MKLRTAFIALLILAAQCRTQQHGTAGEITLENTHWRLVEINGSAVTTPPDGREVYMTLTIEENQHLLKGHAGCNGLGGDFQATGKTIRFQPITTRMYCESQMNVENQFIKMLVAADNYRINGKSLALYAGEKMLGRFETEGADGSIR